MNCLVRAAVSGDLPALLALYRHLNPEDSAPEADTARARFQDILAQPGMTILLAFAGDRLAASCTLIIVPNLTRGGASYGFVENVVTHSDHRRQGADRAVLAEAAQRAEAAGCYKLMLLTGRDRPDIHAFYQSCGYRQDKTGYQIRFAARS